MRHPQAPLPVTAHMDMLRTLPKAALLFPHIGRLSLAARRPIALTRVVVLVNKPCLQSSTSWASQWHPRTILQAPLVKQHHQHHQHRHLSTHRLM